MHSPFLFCLDFKGFSLDDFKFERTWTDKELKSRQENLKLKLAAELKALRSARSKKAAREKNQKEAEKDPNAPVFRRLPSNIIRVEPIATQASGSTSKGKGKESDLLCKSQVMLLIYKDKLPVNSPIHNFEERTHLSNAEIEEIDLDTVGEQEWLAFSQIYLADTSELWKQVQTSLSDHIVRTVRKRTNFRRGPT